MRERPRLEWCHCSCLLALLVIALTQHTGHALNEAPQQAPSGRASVNTNHQTPEAGKETPLNIGSERRTHQETQLTTLGAPTPLMDLPAYQYSHAAPTAKGESNNLPSKLVELANQESAALETASQAYLEQQSLELDWIHGRRPRRSPGSDSVVKTTVVRGLIGQQVVVPCGAGLQAAPASQPAGSRTNSPRHGPAQQQAKRNISLLVWHKDGNMDAPVFVADARNVAQLRDAKQVLGSEWLRGRARLLGQEERPPALLLEPARESDAGLYTCTLEFKEAPTEIHQILLELVDPPRNMQIRESVGSPNERPVTGFMAGPFDEQSSATLSCQAESGNPQAQLSWWRLESSWPLGAPGVAGTVEAPPSAINSIADSLVTVSLEGQPQQHYLVAELAASNRRAPNSLKVPFQSVAGNQRMLASHWIRVPSQPATDEAAGSPDRPALQSAHLELNKLSRGQLHQQFLCTASNNNFSAPLNSSVKLDLNLKPSEVRIVNKQVYIFRANQKAIVECRVFGSRPAPHISWLRGGQPVVQEAGEPIPSEAPQLEGARSEHALASDEESEPATATVTTTTTTTTTSTTTTSSGVRISEFSDMKEVGNNLAKISYLSFIPQASDHQRQLTCSAHNPRLGAASSLSDSLVMNVHYPAKLSLELGAGLAAGSISLGMDVFMECSVDSNPPIDEINWLFNGRPLVANVSAGVLIFNATLVLQKLQIDQRGAYQCIGQNSLSKFQSNKLHLRPKFKPVCDYSLTKTKHEIPVNQSAKIECNVLAEPSEGLHFEWQFNQTYQPSQGNSLAEYQQQYQLEDIRQFETNSTQSHATFRPQTRRHQGQLLCWASNSVGTQMRPCVIQVVTSELPAPVFGCFFDDITNASFSVHCQSDKLFPASSFSSNRGQQQQQNYLLELHSSDDNGPRGASQTEASSVDGRAGADEPSQTTTSTPTWLLQSGQESRDTLDNTHDNEPDRQLSTAARTRTTKVVQLTANSPSFFVGGLESATNYNVIIYAIDAKGRSPPSFNQVTTLPLEQQLDESGSNILNPSETTAAADKRQWQMLSLPQRFLEYFSGASDQPKVRPFVVVASVIIISSLALMMGVFFISRSCRLPSRASNLVGGAQQHLNSCKPEVYDKRKPVVEKNVQLSLCDPTRMRALAGGNGSDSSRETNTDSTTLSMTLAHAPATCGGPTELSLDRRMLSTTTNKAANLSKLNCQDAASRLCQSVHRRRSSLAQDASSTLYSPSTELNRDPGAGLQLESGSRCSSSYSSSLKHGPVNINPKVIGVSHLGHQSAVCAQMAQLSPPSGFGAGYQTQPTNQDRYLIQCQHTANLNEPIYVISNAPGGCLSRCPADNSLELIDPSEHLWALQQQRKHQLASNELLNSYDTTPSSCRNYTGELVGRPLEPGLAPVRFLTSSASIPVSLSGCQQFLEAQHRGSPRQCLPAQLCLEERAEDGASFLAASPVELGHVTSHPNSPDNHLMYYGVVDEQQPRMQES